MLQKLRSRHPVDLPYSGFGRRAGFALLWTGLFGLFVALPLLGALAASANESIRRTLVLVAAGFGTLLFVILVGGIRGKFGWQR